MLDSIKIKLWNKGALDKIIPIVETSIKYIQQQKDSSALAKNIWNLALCHEFLGNYPIAIKNNKKAELISQSCNDLEHLPGIYSSFGRIYMRTYEDSLALIYMHKGLEIALEEEQWGTYSISCNGLGMLYFNNEDYQQAIEYFEKIFPIRDSIKNKTLIASPLSNLGAAYSKIGEIEKAIQYLKESIELYSAAKAYHELHTPYEGLGVAYRKALNYEKALEYHKKAYEIRARYNMRNRIAGSVSNIALLLSEMNRPEEALQFFKEENMLGDRLEEFESWEHAQAVATTYEKLKDYKNALKYQQMAFMFKDSLINETQTKTLKEMEERFKTKQKQAALELTETENELLKSEKQAARSLNIGLGTIAILLLVSVLSLWTFLKIKKEQNRQLESSNLTLHKLNEGLSEELEEKESQLLAPDKLADKIINLTSNGKEAVKLGDILYFKAQGKAVNVYTKTKTHWDWVTLGGYQKILPPQLFLKVQRSYIVNILHVKTRKANTLIMSDGQEVNISRMEKERVNMILDQRELK